MGEELRIFKLIKEIHKENQKKCNKAMADEGLKITKPQLDMMVYLKENQDREINAKNIEEDFHLTNPTVAGFLNRLEKKQLIQKKKSEKGFKYKAIELTKRGEELLEAIQKRGMNFTLLALKDIPKEDLITIVNTLEKILVNIQKN